MRGEIRAWSPDVKKRSRGSSELSIHHAERPKTVTLERQNDRKRHYHSDKISSRHLCWNVLEGDLMVTDLQRGEAYDLNNL